MTTEELTQEWFYIYGERLGILCGDGKPTTEQIQIAAAEADAAVEALKRLPDDN